ncbi:type VI secretion system secreted protein Hcp [Andreprevotia lacus DSM 23236]|jgi:type VI secretion system secreted protein Hcp|uniref:Type VI secretion system secreted protein Hcp n=1 Tax=Andreprevotia lacus DSM 23236 TaxID=1121001 RepID=A0A1W1XFU6_9NEIS|nr:type VI secretion system tube protein Hcp [Andreprevotia lacus]SMC22866.1 type VI secretion system secreted protein Hcp [Andreprevotia lacus DSM 23236]
MAYDSYLKIGDVKGESTDDAHKDWIELYSFSLGISNPVTVGSATGGLTAGKASFSSFSVMKKYDKASVKLASASAAGKHFDKCEVELCLTTGAKHTYIKYVFEDCMIESIQWSGSSGGDDRPTESLSIAYGKVTWEYTPIKHDGTTDSKIGPEGWNVTTNVKV